MTETETTKIEETAKTQNTESKVEISSEKKAAQEPEKRAKTFANKDTQANTQPYKKPHFGNHEGGLNFKKRFVFKKRECYLTKNKISHVDYKDIELLKRFVGRNGRILPRRFTGTNALFQRKISNAIKKARAIALLPYVGEIEYFRKKTDRFNKPGENRFHKSGEKSGFKHYNDNDNNKTDIVKKNDEAKKVENPS